MNGCKHMTRCFASLVNSEMQIKTMRYHSAPLEWLKLKRLAILSVGNDIEQMNFHRLLMGIQNGLMILENSLVISYKFKYILST